jgi:hypothetical protein
VPVKPDWGKLRLSGGEIFAGMEQQIHKEIHHQEMFLGIACHSSLDSVAWRFIRDYGIFEHFSHQLIRCGDGWLSVDKQETIPDSTAELDLASRIIGSS